MLASEPTLCTAANRLCCCYRPSPLKIAGLKRKAGSDAESDGGPPPAKVLIASPAASAEPKFNRHVRLRPSPGCQALHGVES